MKQATRKKQDTERVFRETRNKNAMKSYEAAAEKQINEEKLKLIWLRRAEADKTFRSILFLAHGNER